MKKNNSKKNDNNDFNNLKWSDDMTNNIKEEKERLMQSKLIEEIQNDYEIKEMITVFLYGYEKNKILKKINCALIPKMIIKDALSDLEFEFDISDSSKNGIPKLFIDSEGAKYLQIGNEKGIEPLIVICDSDGIREEYLEINEKFRYFHNLYHDKETDQYIKINENGDEEIVAIVKPNQVQIRLKEIRQFLTIKEMYLSIQFDCTEYSKLSLEELKLEKIQKKKENDLMRWFYYNGKSSVGERYPYFSRLLGKKLISPS